MDSCSTYAALYDTVDLGQWKQACAILKELLHLSHLRDDLESILSIEGSHERDLDKPEIQQPRDSQLKANRTEEALGTFLEVAQDVSANLGALVRVHEEWLGETTEQQRDLVLVANDIYRTLKDLADTAAAA